MSTIFEKVIVCMAVVFPLAACGGGDSGTGPVTVASVTVRAPSDTVSLGDSLQLTAEVRDGSGNVLTGRTVTWSSDNGATVSNTGVVRATVPGAVTATATAEGRSGSMGLTVPPLRWRSVAAGWLHTCAIRDDGRAYCWGSNYNGQLGDNRASGKASLVPVQVASSERWNSLVAGDGYTCGIDTVGKTACWGSITHEVYGGLWTPQRVNPDPGLRVLAAGLRHVCGIDLNNSLYCWESGDLAPGLVTGGLSFKAVAPGDGLTCALRTDGEHYCWAGGSQGTPAPAPVAVRLESLVRGGDLTREHACGIAGGDAYCWGYNTRGQVGGGEFHNKDSPLVRVQAPAGVLFRTLSAGGHTWSSSMGYTCGISNEDTLYCWGSNQSGQLGDGTTTSRAIPVPVVGGRKFRQVSVGAEHTCAITTEGDLYCWGTSAAGQLGDGRSGQGVFSTTPVLVDFLN